MQNPLLELVEAFNQNEFEGERLLDHIDQLNLVAANDYSSFVRFCANINVEAIYIILEKYSSATSQRQLSTKIATSACELLNKIFSNLPVLDIVEKYGSFIKNSASINCLPFHLLCLQQTLRLVDENNFSYFMSNPDLIEMTIHFLCEPNTQYYTISGKILKKLTAQSGNGWLFSDNLVYLFKKQLIMKNSVVKFRIYEVFVDYVTKYPEYIEACKSCKIFESLIDILVKGDDVLSQLNALEMVSQLATSGSQGLDYVQENGVIGWAGSVFTSWTEDPLMSFLLPGCVKFFGVLCSANPMEIIPQYKSVLTKIFELIQGEDEVLRCLCAETIAFICSKSDGLKIIYRESDAIKEAVRFMAKIISNPGEDDYVRKRIIQSLAGVFDHNPEDIEIFMICEKLYRHLDDNPIKLLMSLAQKPFVEVRYGGLTLLRNISKYSWVEQDMVLCPTFVEYLLDRSTESDKEAKELKYDIIRTLSVSATALENFGRDYFEKLGLYSTQGPFYSESHVAVSYEGED